MTVVAVAERSCFKVLMERQELTINAAHQNGNPIHIVTFKDWIQRKSWKIINRRIEFNCVL